MSEVGDRDAVVRALIERERWTEGDRPAVVGEMQASAGRRRARCPRWAWASPWSPQRAHW